MSDLEVLVCAFRKGYEAAAKGFDAQDLDVSVVGRSFMITGANSGVGRATAMAVAQKGRLRFALSCADYGLGSLLHMCVFPGGTVHMVCRNKERAEEAREVIVNESGNTVSCFKVEKMMSEREAGFDLVVVRRCTSILSTWRKRVKFGSLLRPSSSSIQL